MVIAFGICSAIALDTATKHGHEKVRKKIRCAEPLGGPQGCPLALRGRQRRVSANPLTSTEVVLVLGWVVSGVPAAVVAVKDFNHEHRLFVPLAALHSRYYVTLTKKRISWFSTYSWYVRFLFTLVIKEKRATPFICHIA